MTIRTYISFDITFFYAYIFVAMLQTHSIVFSVVPLLIVGISLGITRLKGYHSDK